jgi:hypothetical protein
MSTTSALGGVVRRREDPALVTGPVSTSTT